MNPMPYTVITFPFLFAVMFGDLGHGLVLTIFAAFMIIYQNKLKKKKIEGEIQRIFFNGRFIILLMGKIFISTNHSNLKKMCWLFYATSFIFLFRGKGFLKKVVLTNKN